MTPVISEISSMFNYRRLFVRLFTVYLLMQSSYAEAQSFNCQPLADNDKVCFIGDSITHAGLYQKILRDFYLARYPRMQIQFINCGISGDSLPNVFARFDSDIAVHQPTVAYVMLGMNDLRLHRFKAGMNNAISPEDDAVKAYAVRLEELVKKLKTLQPRQIVLMSPTIYDQYVQNPKALPPYTGADAGLALMTDNTRQIAQANSLGFVDLHTPMLQWTRNLQKENPALSLVGLDRIHPNSFGHYLMAYLILQAQGQTDHLPDVPVLQVDLLKPTQTITIDRWPMTVDSNLAQIPQLAQLYAPFTTMPCRITGLSVGNYIMQIGNVGSTTLAITSDQQLVDLAYSASPIRTISTKLFTHSACLHDMIIHRLRDPLAAGKFLQNEYKSNPELPKDEIQAAQTVLKAGKQGYVANLYRNLVDYGSRDKQQQTREAIACLRETLHKTAQPTSMIMTLKPGQSTPAETSRMIMQADGSRAYLPVNATMTDAWFDHRLKDYSDAKELGICGNSINAKTAYLQWRLPDDLKPQQVHNVTLVLNEVYAMQIDQIWLARICTDWQASNVNYYHAPSTDDQLLCQTQPADGKWTFRSDALTACVMQWLTDPSSNHGLAVLYKNWRGHGSFTYKENPPLLIIE